MEVNWFACLIFLTAQVTFRATATTVVCPTNCSCTTTATSLTVDCHKLPVIDREGLTEELDSLLSGDAIYGRLTHLTIVNTPLTRVPSSVCRLTTLTRLDLHDNRLTRLPDNCLTHLTALTELEASINNITELQDGLFDGLRKLKTLHLIRNQIASIGLRVFNSSSMLTGLSNIRLSHNRLTSLEPWPYFIGVNADRRQKATVDLGDNSISTFTNMMRWKPKCGVSQPMYLNLRLSANSVRRVSDILRGWNLTVPTLFCLVPFHNEPAAHFLLHNNFLNCDCVDYRIYSIVRYFHRLDFLEEAYCGEPKSLYNKRVNSVPLDEFVCELTERCPPGCRCVHRPANQTVHVDCSNANLTVLPLELPELPKSYTKYKLDFSDNRRLRCLEHRDYFVDTSILDVSNCGVETVENWTDVFRLKDVYLHGNQLTSLPRSAAALNVTTEHLSIYNNPWSCDCDSGWFARWLNGSVSQHLVNSKYISCASPARLQGRNVLTISDEELCVDPVRRALAIGMSSVAAAVVLLLSVGVIVYRLRVKLYTRWKFHPFERDECHGEDMDYDVFLSCSSDDNLPHGNDIREQLERRGYRVCYPPRDFVAGEPICDNIYCAVVRSKRTVCLLTPHFFESNFCMYEFDVAYHHNVMVKRKKRLIVLMALDSPTDLYANDASETMALRQYLRQYTYIDYAVEDWLDRLLYALPVRGMDRDERDQDASVIQQDDGIGLCDRDLIVV